MNCNNREIFKAIFEDKWLSIEYKNSTNQITNYWIGINDIILSDNPKLIVEGLHLGKGSLANLEIYFHRIQKAFVLDGTYYQVPISLKNNIENNRNKYNCIFRNITNLKIINYLIECNKMDTTPYKSDFAFIKRIDNDILSDYNYQLNNDQFITIIKAFQINSTQTNQFKYKQLVLNMISIYTKEGLYVLAYRNLNFDVKKRCFVPDNYVSFCEEFCLETNKKLSIRNFIDEEDLLLFNNYNSNYEIIKNIISGNGYIVDDNPYIIALGRDIPIDLTRQFSHLSSLLESGKASYPIKAFFGQLVKPITRKKDYPISLINKKINLDQLLAIYHSIKYPLTYVQGPPGSGKTSTIINTILTGYLNEKTILFSSYNNHPIDSVFEQLCNMKYCDDIIPFPILRLGNHEKIKEAIKYIKHLYQECINAFPIIDNTKLLTTNNKELSQMLKDYEELLELNERKEAIEKILESTSNNFQFTLDLQTSQLNSINNRIKKIKTINDEEALKHIINNEEFNRLLYNSSISRISHLSEPKYEDLRTILELTDEEEAIISFNKFCSNDENIKKLLKIFPIIATTCISAAKLGNPTIHFDLTIIDEASQCNNAVSLIPIIRSENLMLVGDPNQLNPVIVLDQKINDYLKNKYSISEEYDYINNSIYKTMLSTDSISREILLSHHYRCHKDIINFCNQKYYNNKLIIKSNSIESNPLVFVDLPHSTSDSKNCAPLEVDEIIKYIHSHREKSIGIITPFVKQKKIIEKRLLQEDIKDVSCGTVHAFQGDEKDVILFSTAITNKTTDSTYNWLMNNKELLNVAVSRAKNKLIIFTNYSDLTNLHLNNPQQRDDLFELANYIKNNGSYKISKIETKSRALGIKPYSTETEQAFMETLSHALDNIIKSEGDCTIKKEVPISHVFKDNITYSNLFYSGRFDFVVYQKDYRGKELPLLAIELDGNEHYDNEKVKTRDAKKKQICEEHGFELIRVNNNYARRYYYIKEVLINYFSK